MHTAMVISPHADDAAIFCGGTLAQWANAGWRVILVRVTDDAKDSVGLSLEETVRRNAAELRDAARIFGVAEIVELGFPTDSLGDVSEVSLRERFVYLFRKYRPYAVFSFDAFGKFEDNVDHIQIALAVQEANWVSRFDLHHPEHRQEGLEPVAICEMWYFGRHLPDANHAEDITDAIDQKIDAICAHRTMIDHMLHQFQMHCRAWGRRVPLLDAARESNPRPLVEAVFRQQAEAVAAQFGLPAGRLAESFRLTRFGGLEGLFQSLSEPIEGLPQGPDRPSLVAAASSAPPLP